MSAQLERSERKREEGRFICSCTCRLSTQPCACMFHLAKIMLWKGQIRMYQFIRWSFWAHQWFRQCNKCTRLYVGILFYDRSHQKHFIRHNQSIYASFSIVPWTKDVIYNYRGPQCARKRDRKLMVEAEYRCGSEWGRVQAVLQYTPASTQ